ncbi:MAG TPA: asparagine synthase-related protein [Methanothrix sp.]|nr:asparagine synthase-related protein [Methanothrix sp.]
MKVAVLFSGGKDSSLAALLLEPFFDEIELVTFGFQGEESWTRASDAAEEIGHPHQRMIFPEEVEEKALKILLSKGFPNDALDYVHAIAVETVAKECEFVADGTRRDDRAPKMDWSAIRSLEDRLHVQYLRPLAGLGQKSIRAMASRYLDFEEMLSQKYPASDYEVGLRYALKERYGQEKVDCIFPSNHTHTRIIRRKRFVQEIKGQEDQACQSIQSES